MPEHIWSVLCYKGCLDQYSNLVSLLDVIEGIQLRSIGPLPAGEKAFVGLPFQLNLVSLWARAAPDTPEKFSVRALVVKPDGAEVVPQVFIDGDLTEKRRLRTFMRLDALPFGGPGVYRFAVECRSDDEWRRVASIPLEVEVAESVSSPKPAPTPAKRAPAKPKPRPKNRRH